MTTAIPAYKLADFSINNKKFKKAYENQSKNIVK